MQALAIGGQAEPLALLFYLRPRVRTFPIFALLY
jgi:hypothetical protein